MTTLASIPSLSRPAARLAAALMLGFGALVGQAQLVAGPGVIQNEGGPEAILIVDFDDDGVLDLLATAPVTNRLSIHIGRGNGQFRFPLSVTVGSGLADLAAGDVDGNGATDVLGVDRVSGDLVIMHQFPQTPIPYRVSRIAGEDEPNSLSLRDLEGDGDLDVIVAFGGADEIGIYRNLGSQFAPLEHRPVGDGPSSLRVFERTPPLYVVAQRGVLSRNVVIYDANWAVQQTLLVHPVSDIRPLYWNGDAELDFLLLDQDGVAQVFLGNSGNWSAGPNWSISPGATATLPFAAQGGQPGAVVLEGANNRLTVHVDGAPGPAPDPGWYLGGGVQRMAMADSDADGTDEYYVPLPQDNLILVLRRSGDALRGYRSYRAGALPSRMRSHAAVGGLPSRLYALCVIDDELWSYDQLGGELVPLPPLPVQSDARDFRLGSLDGDGLPDVAVLSLTQGVRLFRSSGSGFDPPLDIPISGDLRDLELAQLDDDGHLDLAVADFAVQGIRLFHGDGLGGFTPGDTLICLDPPVAVRRRDFDLDGREDLFVVGSDRRACLFYRNADGSFQRASWLLGNDLRGIAIGHFNEDAYPDVAIGNAGDQTYSVLSSVLPRFLTITEEDRAAPDGSEAMTAVDVDGDGLDDLAMTSSTSRSASVHVATGDGRFAPPIRVRCSTLPLDLHSFDGNGDGVGDIFVTDGLGSSLVMIEAIGGTQPAPGGPPVTATPVATQLAELRVHPNPARGVMQMRIHSAAGAPTFRVFDLRGRLVSRLRSRAEGGGWYAAQWSGEEVAAGRYYLQVRAGEAQLTRTLLRLPR